MAREALNRDPVVFTDAQISSVARGFANVVKRTGCVLYACSILPNHTHVVPARSRYHVEYLVGLLKGGASRQLEVDGLHPFQNERSPDGTLPSPWQEDCWKVFLNNDGEIVRSIDYVVKNPEKHGRPPQKWGFVTPFVPVAALPTILLPDFPHPPSRRPRDGGNRWTCSLRVQNEKRCPSGGAANRSFRKDTRARMRGVLLREAFE
jgi:REP element-mobilizing transposase RayT